MPIIGPRRPSGNGAPVIVFKPYIDTMAIHLPVHDIMTRERSRLRDAYGGFLDIRQRTKDIGGGKVINYTMIAAQCPQPEYIIEVDRLCGKYGGNLSRLDIAYEAVPDPDMPPQEQMRWINAHIIMKHRPAGPIKRIANSEDPDDDGFYLNPFAHIYDTPRDACLYGDRPSKLDPTIPRAAKFETRLRGPKAITKPFRDGENCTPIGRPRDVITVNPSQIIGRDFTFVDYDVREFRERFIRKAATKDADRWNTKRIIENLNRNWTKNHHQFDFAQRIHDYDPRFTINENPSLVVIPDAFTWGATRRSQVKECQ